MFGGLSMREDRGATCGGTLGVPGRGLCTGGATMGFYGTYFKNSDTVWV